MFNEFRSTQLSIEQLQRVEKIRQQFNDLLSELVIVCPAGRELSLTRTKLEEACFFAVKSVAQESK